MKKIISLIAVIILLVLVIVYGIMSNLYNDLFNSTQLFLITISFSVLLFLLGIILVLFYYRKKDKKIAWLSNRLEQWSNLSVHVNKAGDEVFSELPIGIIIYDEQEEIKWVNRFAKVIFNVDLIDKSLEEVDSNLQKLISSNLETFTYELYEKSYDIIHKKNNRLLYLFDVSSRETLSKSYNNKIPALGIITLDNLDVETKAFDMQEKINLRGQYLGEISDWTAKYNSYLKSYDDGSLFIVSNQESLLSMIDDKFDILEKIRNISKSNGVRVTGSIGFACYDTNYEELGTFTQKSFDLAEKRGGDQAVVNIQNKKVQYFGASLNAIEKNTYLHARSKTLELKDIIDSSRNVYVMGHMQTDADSLGAMIGALKLGLMSGKKTNMVLDPLKIDATSTKIYNEILLSSESFKNNIVSFNQTDVDDNSLLIVVDTQSSKLVMDVDFLKKFKKIAIIDHHRAGEGAIENPIFSYIEPYASSTVELISEMMMFYNSKVPLNLSVLEANIMLAGLVVDTNNFTFRCGSRAFEAASRLREQGADMIFVKKLLRNDFSMQMRLNKYITTAKILLNQFAIVQINEVIEDRIFLAQISESLLSIDGVNASFTIANTVNSNGENVSISARSYEHVNVQLIMEELGGGGHLNSAATQMTSCTVSEAFSKLEIILNRDYEIGDKKMKIILTEDVKGRGVKNQIIDVASGFGNYLITNKKGILATEKSLSDLQNQLDAEKNRIDDEKKMILKIKSELENKTVSVYIKVGQDGKSFGSITTKQISEELESQYGIQIDKRKITLPLEINTVGVFSANVNLYKDIVANLEVNVLEK